MTHLDDFEINLTQEQLDAPYYTDWDNETLGGIVRAALLDIKEVSGLSEFDRLIAASGATLMIDNARQAGGNELKIKLTLKSGEKWLVSAKRVQE